MKVKNIINKTKLEQSEMEFVVQEYIKELKGQTIEINLMKYTDRMPDMFINLHLQNQLQMLDQAFVKACHYFSNK